MSLHVLRAVSSDPKVIDWTDDLFAMLLANVDRDKPNSGSLEFVLYILNEHELDVHARTKDNETLLIVACKSAVQSCVRPLLELGSDPNARDRFGNTALYHAANKNRADAAQMLVEFGANIHGVSDTFKTPPLHRAAMVGAVGILNMLLENGAPVNTTTSEGSSAIRLANTLGKSECVRVLLAAGASVHVGPEPFEYSGLALNKVVKAHYTDWSKKLSQGHIPQNPAELLALASVMPVHHMKHVPEPCEMIQRLFTTLPHTKPLNKLYEEFFGHPRTLKVMENLQQLRAAARSSGAGL